MRKNSQLSSSPITPSFASIRWRSFQNLFRSRKSRKYREPLDDGHSGRVEVALAPPVESAHAGVVDDRERHEQGL